MTIQTDYSRDEWDLIVGAPGLVALVIIQTAGCSPEAGYAKLRAVTTAIEETGAQGTGSLLIQAVADAMRVGQAPLWPTECPSALADPRGWALEACRQLVALLAQRAPAAEDEAYTHWLMRIAWRAALAPEHEGRVDDALAPRHAWQRAALEALAAALNVPLAGAAMPVS